MLFTSASSSLSNEPFNKIELLDQQQPDEEGMQAYHQSFNPQAYITNNNGAVAAAAAAAYYQHHNPANYVIPSQYSLPDAFGYCPTGNPNAVGLAANPQSYPGQQVNEKLFNYFYYLLSGLF